MCKEGSNAIHVTKKRKKEKEKKKTLNKLHIYDIPSIYDVIFHSGLICWS